MNRLYYKLLLGCSIILLLGCQNNDYDLENIVPQMYHKILSLKQSGEIQLELSGAETEYKKELFVWKGGSQTELEAKASLRLFTESELDDYNTLNGTDYKLLKKENYSLSNSTFEFSSKDNFKKSELVLYPQRISEDMASTHEKYILPLRLVSEQDSVLATKNSIIFIIDILQ